MAPSRREKRSTLGFPCRSAVAGAAAATSGSRAVVLLLALSALALTTLGCGDGRAMSLSTPAPVTTVDWLFPDGAGTSAHDVFMAAASRGVSETSSYSVDDRRLWIPRADSATEKEWAYWSDIALSPDIVKIQARPAPGTYESPGNDSRAVYGILDYAIFWIGHDVQPDGGHSGVGHDYLADNRFRVPVDGSRPDFLVANVAWKGDALGVEKASENPVWGPAVLTMTSVATDSSERLTYTLNLDVSFLHPNGVQQIRIATPGADGAFGTAVSADMGARIEGIFLGPRAEEASGIFETADHFGAFGVKK